MKKAILIFALSRHPWIGGIYYRKNIIFSLLQNEKISSQYQIVVLTNKKYQKVFSDISGDVKIVTCRDDANPIIGAWYAFFCSLKYHVKFVFPLINIPFLKCLGITPISWIADFQHNYYPEFFSTEEVKQRNYNFKRMARNENPLVVSSVNAEEDLKKIYNSKRENLYVVHFVSYIENQVKQLTPEVEQGILKKFSLSAKNYICISNQFWQHKNHIVVFRAIEELNKKISNYSFQFVFTGELNDRRNLDYYSELKEIMDRESIRDSIKILGFIDRTDQIAIMKNAKFIIQPSLYEGWGTVLEDAKILDQRVILSDIPVHREQKNDNCILFNPHSPRDLVDKILEISNETYQPDIKRRIEVMHKNAFNYSREFEKILL